MYAVLICKHQQSRQGRRFYTGTTHVLWWSEWNVSQNHDVGRGRLLERTKQNRHTKGGPYLYSSPTRALHCGQRCSARHGRRNSLVTSCPFEHLNRADLVLLRRSRWRESLTRAANEAADGDTETWSASRRARGKPKPWKRRRGLDTLALSHLKTAFYNANDTACRREHKVPYWKRLLVGFRVFQVHSSSTWGLFSSFDLVFLYCRRKIGVLSPLML